MGLSRWAVCLLMVAVAALGAQPGATAAHGATTWQAVLASIPTLVATPAVGSPGQAVILMGFTFSPVQMVSLYWDSTSSAALTTTTADATGAFTVPVTIPSATSGFHTFIAVSQSTAVSATAVFLIQPLIGLTQTSGRVGTLVLLAGVGFGASEGVKVAWNAGIGSVLGATATNQYGRFGGPTAVAFKVPPSKPGNHLVCAKGQSSGVVSCQNFTVTG